MHLMIDWYPSLCNVFQCGHLCHALKQSVHIAVGGLNMSLSRIS
jgi:hypothetical protein